ncbi:MAG: rhodanese-like domain-containing protein [Bacteroidales bacterium]|nr:rhodanese-like domain-containing protein [Bacteroidales bacterium]
MKNLFEGKGIKSGKSLSLSPKEAVNACADGAIIVDVREEYLNSYKMFGVHEVIYLPMSHFKQNYVTLPEDKYLILADSAGLKSREATLFLLEKGYNKAANLAGGLVEWERDKMPLNMDVNQRLTGSCMCQLKPRERKKST